MPSPEPLGLGLEQFGSGHLDCDVVAPHCTPPTFSIDLGAQLVTDGRKRNNISPAVHQINLTLLVAHVKGPL